jgi:flagellar hook-basal body complex protein FliE
MLSNINSALGAYQQALGRVEAKLPQEKPADNLGEFRNMVVNAVDGAANLSKNSERLSMLHVAGKADIQDVVLAVSNAELALSTVVAVRDTAIRAYKDILSMPM